MEDPRDILESIASNNSRVEILQYRKLLGSTDIDTAKSLYYAAQSGIQLRQVRIVLNGGESMVESGMMHFMKGTISLENKIGGLGGLAKKMISSALTSETTFKPTYKGKGEIYLEPTFAHFLLIQLNNEEMIVEKGMFVACEGSVKVGVAVQKNVSSALLGGESLVQTSISGTGWCVLNSPVPTPEIVRCQLQNEKLSVDGNFALLRKGNIEFRVEKSSKSLIGASTSGEGLLQTFSGTGEVWLAPTLAVYERLRTESVAGLAQVQASMGQDT